MMVNNENSPLVIGSPYPRAKARGFTGSQTWRVFGIENRRTKVRGFQPAPIFDKLGIAAVLFVLLSCIVGAQDAEEKKKGEFDLSKLTPEEIASLTPEQKNKITAEQLQEHLEKIGNLGEFAHAAEAVSLKYGVRVAGLRHGARLTGNTLAVLTGEQDSLDLTGKQQWELTINDKGEILVTGPERISRLTIRTRDAFTVTGSVNLILEDGTAKQVRDVSFKQDTFYVKKGNQANVDTYKVFASDNDITLYFNKLPEARENYFSILADGLSIGTKEAGMVWVEPQPGNMLFNMVKRNYETTPPSLIPDERDTLSLKVADGDQLYVTSRVQKGLTPLINHQHKGGAVQIQTGRMMFHVDSGRIELVKPKPLPLNTPIGIIRSSVAFELAKGENILRTSSSNRYALLKDGREVLGTNMGLQVSNLLDANSMKTLEDLQHKYPGTTFSIINYDKDIQQFEQEIEEAKQKEDDMEISFLENQIGELKKISIQEISSNMVQLVDKALTDDKELGKKVRTIMFDGRFNAAGGASAEEGGRLTFGERLADSSTLLKFYPSERESPSPYSTIKHELAHVSDHLVQLNEEQYPDEIRAQRGLQATYNRALVNKFVSMAGSDAFKQMIGGLQKFQQRLAALSELKRFSERPLSPEDMEKEHGKISPEEYEPYDSFLLFNLANELSQPLTAFAHAEQGEEEKLENIPSVVFEIHELLKDMRTEYLPAKKYEQQFVKFIKEETGLPPYAFRDYNKERDTATSLVSAPHFAEVSSTLTEINRDLVRRKIAQGNDFLREATQLAYDTEKIDAEEYAYRMGAYCVSHPCGKCLMYTLTCTQEPASP